MEILCSASGIVDVKRPGQGILDMAGAGFKEIFLDVNLYCTEMELYGQRQDTDEWTSLILSDTAKLGACVQSMLQKAAANGLQIAMVRVPFLQENTRRVDLSDMLMQLSRESIKFCGEIRCRYIVIPPFFAGVAKGKEWEVNRNNYLQLAETARKYDVTILLQNQCKSVNGHLVRGICSDGNMAVEWIEKLNLEAGEERFGFCMDVGVCNLCGQDIQELIRILDKHTKAVILRDCDGHDESSLLPFTCVSQGQSQTNWLSMIRGLREIGFDGVMVLDMADTAAVFSPLLRPQLMTLARSVMDFFEFQIGIESLLKKYKHIVLFGAGNMCRNYMKCYGEKYPPLFTCDNNKALWGTTFCGLEVKNPEVLRNLPDDCGALICNVYYREIEKQLRDMGVKNIGFFNDEYLPSFHFDRVRRG